MKITIVTVVFNDKEHILKTIDSVHSQTVRKNMEYIIVDGESTDGTSELIESRGNRIDKYIREKDTGIYNAMNKGIKNAEGDYIVFMNSGDCFTATDTVERVINYIMLSGKSPALVYGDYRESRAGVCSSPIPSRNPKMIWYGAVASHQSCFYNREFLSENNLLYDESYKIAADYKLTMQVIKQSEGDVLRIPLCVSDFDVAGLSNLNQDLGLKEANRVRREILGWGKTKELMMTAVLLSARAAKRHGGKLYKTLRRL